MLISMFKGECKHCDEEFVIATGSPDVCNRCQNVITLVGNLPIAIIEKLLSAAAGPNWGRGSFKITWQDDTATPKRTRRR